MKERGVELTKEDLRAVYCWKKFSLKEIARRAGVSQGTILRKMDHFGIKKTRLKERKIEISKEVLHDLYWKQKKKPREIAQMFGIKNERTVREKMEKFGIARRTQSEAMTVKFKADFSGDLNEKAYLLGLRTGDFHTKIIKQCFRFQTSTTHPAQVEMLRKAFEKYSECCTYLYKSKREDREDEWFIYVDLNKSFEFLLNKPERIPEWIMENEEYFYQFLVGYMDSEGSWVINRSHEKDVRFKFQIKSGDLEVLKQLKEKLNSLNYFTSFYLSAKKGTERNYGKLNKDMYHIVIQQKKKVLELAKVLLPLSKHSEKIRKMNFLLNNSEGRVEILKKWYKLSEEIERENLNFKEKEGQEPK